MWWVSGAAWLLPPPRVPLNLVLSVPSPDDSVAAPKSPWGINIIKKNKKAAPRAFGVRLEECQPAIENQVWPPHCRAGREAGDGGTEVGGGGAFGSSCPLLLQTQLGKPTEAEAELRQSSEPLTPRQCRFSDQGRALGVFLTPDWRWRGPFVPA